MSTFAVIGGGVSGMAAARMLAGAKPLSGPAPEPALPHGVPPSGRTRVVLIEASSRLGGKVLTSDDGEAAFDTGPDQFLRRDPSAENWCRRLGLGDDLVEPAARRAGVFSYGRSRELPPSLVLGIPTEPLRAGDTGAVSAAGCWRGELDRVLPGRILAEGELGLDETADASLELPAGTILRRRLGDELVDRLADPLLGGINAGSLDRLSLGTIAPRVAEALVGRRDLLEPLSALARAQSPAGTSSPFYGLRGGLGRLIERAGAELSGLGVEVRSRVAVTALEKTPGGYG
ncbi:MAG: protoporphyrinogen/coproporphyrinogen oxidase, partial [Acidimicrobiales bacterium]